MELEIYSFEDLINTIEQNDFDKKQLDLLIWHTLKRIAFYNSKAELINFLKDFWQKWQEAPEKPIFLGLESLDLEFQTKTNNFKA